MALDIRVYNVLLYEPKDVKPTLKIAPMILTELEERANQRFTKTVIPALAKAGVIAADTSLEEFAAKSPELPPQVAAKIPIPEKEQFAVNAWAYREDSGAPRIPEVLGDLAAMHEKLAPGGIQVTFFNTACPGPNNDYERLAEVVDEFGALTSSTWVATTSLREPIPKAFTAKLGERAEGAKLSGAAARELTVATGTPCLIPVGDSIVLRAKQDCLQVIYDRLVQIRSAEAPRAKTGG
jgi:hypothetical protein